MSSHQGVFISNQLEGKIEIKSTELKSWAASEPGHKLPYENLEQTLSKICSETLFCPPPQKEMPMEVTKVRCCGRDYIGWEVNFSGLLACLERPAAEWPSRKVNWVKQSVQQRYCKRSCRLDVSALPRCASGRWWAPSPPGTGHPVSMLPDSLPCQCMVATHKHSAGNDPWPGLTPDRKIRSGVGTWEGNHARGHSDNLRITMKF